MKIKLNKNVVVECKPEPNIQGELFIGCHLISCRESNIRCSKSSCEIDKRKLGGGCYSIEEVRDIIIED